MILFVNACVREESRTRRLADCLLQTLAARNPGEAIRTVDLPQIEFPKVDDNFLDRRTALAESGAFTDPLFTYANDFAAADAIVVAAPFWDLSFPAILKQYLEQICVTGITFHYQDNVPRGLCRARKLYFVTTAGGTFLEEFGYGYVRTLARVFFGIPEILLILAEGLDVEGADVERILQEKEQEIRELAGRDIST